MVGVNRNAQKDGSDDSQVKWACPPIRNVTHPLRYYEFTQEEMQALEECDKESFYQRCLPLSCTFAALAYAGVRYGCLRRNPHFGVFPKVTWAALVGHCYGRLSYIADCELKLRQLSNSSHLGNVMRKYYIDRNPQKLPKK